MINCTRIYFYPLKFNLADRFHCVIWQWRVKKPGFIRAVLPLICADRADLLVEVCTCHDDKG
ncbi:hypothetical protein BA171_02100 [Candidatus Hamiltonella defensa (Bemisia tabaci)]|uniref:Uncharacterized protein n=1 Tax=Candidatus Hamiltonella defensa (Bemisia tabaci) TaxID=672795 RepID=A0A249DYU2_9ENTR|nr:hypothetical protein BA171_02100 [Candidatus Hamiltonella defensa (Bemisia tabaci)]